MFFEVLMILKQDFKKNLTITIMLMIMMTSHHHHHHHHVDGSPQQKKKVFRFSFFFVRGRGVSAHCAVNKLGRAFATHCKRQRFIYKYNVVSAEARSGFCNSVQRRILCCTVLTCTEHSLGSSVQNTEHNAHSHSVRTNAKIFHSLPHLFTTAALRFDFFGFGTFRCLRIELFLSWNRNYM